jgi:hypothetical protein
VPEHRTNAAPATVSGFRGGGSIMTRANDQAAIDAIVALAEEIARTSPECADKAMQILDLARTLDSRPDQAAIEDAIEAGTDGDLSDTRVRSASSAVVRSIRDEG